MALMVMMEVMLRESLGLGTLQESDQSESNTLGQLPVHLLFPAPLGTAVWTVAHSHGSRGLALLQLSVVSQGTGWQDLVRMIFVPSRPVQIDDHIMDLPALQDCPDPQLLWLLLDRLTRNWHMEGREVPDNLGFWCSARICI